jgi:hypothetical protein
MSKPRMFVLIGAIALIVGALMPWATVNSGIINLSKAGYEGDGLFTGIAGLIMMIIALVVVGKPGKVYSVAAIILSLLGVLVLFMDIPSLSTSTSTVRIQIGVGVPVTVVGVILAFLGGCMRVPDMVAQPIAPTQVPPPPQAAA